MIGQCFKGATYRYTNRNKTAIIKNMGRIGICSTEESKINEVSE